LSVILPHITLPVLDRITLNTESIDPVVLSQFLSRHKTLSWLSFNGVSHKTPSCLLITPTLALPNLHLIESSDPANFIRLLDALDASPELSIFRFPYDRSSPNSIAALNSLLRRLGRHTGTDIGLQLTLTTSQSRPLDEAERAIASALACVRQVQMAVERREVALEMVPWLALLPGLHFVDFGLCMVGAPVDEKRRFMQEVRAALPATVVIQFPP
jgi:hypothetical protein